MSLCDKTAENLTNNPLKMIFKAMAKVKVFADKQTNKQAKNYMPPIYRCVAIKKSHLSKTMWEL